MKKLFVLMAGIALVASAAQADLIALWTFEVSVPTTSGPLAPESGSGAATSNGAGTFSNPAGNGSLESWSANGWAIGQYWQFQVNLSGYQDVTLSWDQTGSNTGPRDFQLQYSTDGSTFSDFGAVYALANDSWSTTTYKPESTRTADFSAISGINDQAAVYFRLTSTSDVAINGGTVASTGSSRVDNFSVESSLIPEPGTLGLMALGLLGVAVRRRR